MPKLDVDMSPRPHAHRSACSSTYLLYLRALQKTKYSSVPNRRVGRNKREGGKFLENIKHAGRNRRAGRKFSGKSINVQGGNFLANQ
jgi:hypothetical protein